LPILAHSKVYPKTKNMKKIVSTLGVALLCFSLAVTAQVHQITGTVKDDQGAPVPSVSVKIKGTSTITVGDASGSFRISASENSVLVFSAIGFNDLEQRVGKLTTMNISLSKKVAELESVVVTALGVRRKPEEIGYATSTVRSDQITAGKSFNLAQSLSGKVSGLTISNYSSSVNATPRIVLRGLRSLTGNNQALIVLDGVAVPSNTINYINPNDVERVDVMKGGQAATLFGSDGVNGAVIITTKKGTQRPQITVSNSTNAELVAYLPESQYGFGSGSAYGSSREENFHSAENQQYGDAYDGSIRTIGRQLADGSLNRIPYSAVSDARMRFWNTGFTTQTDVSYRAGDAGSSFFTSYQNLHSEGVVPGDIFNRNVLRMNSSKRYGKVSLSFDATYTWDAANRTNTDYYNFALNTPTWAPIDELKDWQNNKFATLGGYFNDYYNSPFWLKDNVRFTTKNTYFNGNVKLEYKPSDALSFTARLALANTNTVQTTTSNRYDFTFFTQRVSFANGFNINYDYLLAGFGRFVSRTAVNGSVGESYSNGNRITGDLFGNFSKDFGQFNVKLIAGGQIVTRTSKSIGSSTSGLIVPELYNLGNSLTGLYQGSDAISDQRKIGGYADLTVGYKGLLYLHGVTRTDYTSVFYNPKAGFNNPSFTTYGGDLSFILTDALPGLKGKVLNSLKLRASYNRNGNDNLDAYSLETTFPVAGGFPYSGMVGTTVGNTVVNPNLRPEVVKTTELGLEASLFDNRVTFEASAYKQKAQDQILSVQVSTATGFSGYLLNAADVDNSGFELDAKVNVFKNRKWSVNVNANYSYIDNKVNQLYGATGVNSLNYQTDGLLSLAADKGFRFPALKTTVLQRDDQGRVIVDPSDGWPLRGADKLYQGSTLPMHNFGAGLNVTFDRFTLIANAEFRGGYIIYNNIGGTMTFTGSSAMTTMYNRDQFVWPNSVYDDGTGKYIPNTSLAVDQYKAIYQGFGDQGFARGMAGVGEFYVASGAFWKLRDLSLSYDIPMSILGNQHAIQGIQLAFFARNLVTLRASDNWFTDPEFSNTSGNSQGINTTGNTPPTRQIGGTLKVTF
jgi:TonB-linked SusC/RagA family outer membrane protein